MSPSIWPRSWKNREVAFNHDIGDPQSPNEERFNLVTHALGLALSLVGLGALLVLSTQHSYSAVFACFIYGASLVGLFASSTLYHACPHGRLKRLARVLDHCMILVLIAGSYTPLMILGLGDWRGFTMLVLVWALAGLGIHHKFSSTNPFGAASVILCVFMGWLVTLVWQPLVSSLGTETTNWLLASGVAYTAGVPFYAWLRLPYNHGIWHLFVLAGAGFHYLAVLKLL